MQMAKLQPELEHKTSTYIDLTLITIYSFTLSCEHNNLYGSYQPKLIEA